MAKAETNEPSLSAADFSRRCKMLAVEFGKEIGLQTGELAFAPEFTSTAAELTLAGRASETIARNRGSSHRVVPLISLGDGISIWTGYRESWRKQGAELKFRFVEAGFTLHVGRSGELSKPQILRSEWVGRRSQAFVEKAGHPHWQLDALESARASTPEQSTLRFGESEPSQPSIEFNSTDTAQTSKLLLGLTVESMHLASATRWWRADGTQVSHVPETVHDLDRWILRCVGYLRQEASRCVIVTLTAQHDEPSE